MNKKIPLGLAISIMAVACAITFILTNSFSLDLFNSKVNVNERTEINRKIEEIDNFVRANYINPIDEAALQNSISGGYIAGIGDKYSSYYSSEAYQTEKLSNDGFILGIGIDVSPDEGGYIKIVNIRENSPAVEIGLQVGDIIVAVDDQDILGVGYNDGVQLLHGSEGTTVKVTVRRSGSDTQYSLVRRKIEKVSVTGKVLEDHVSYIKISTFDQKTPEQFKTMLDTHIASGATELVIDVRNNGGGLLSSVSEVLNNLLPAGDIVTATYKDGTTKVIIKTDGENQVNLPIAVLINSKTASSSELLACSLRDFANAKLVGTTSYGKGVMQTTKELLDGSAVTVTYATYQTLKTPCYDGIGLKPNFEIALTKEEEAAFASLTELTDPQLKKAMEVIHQG